MTDEKPAQLPRPRPRWALPVALAGAAIALTAGLYVFNASGPQATECRALEAQGKAIDAVAMGELAALTGTGKGRGYADMGFNDEAGNKLSIRDFAGKKLLVNFWASWCLPCREEMPALDAIATKYNSDGFMVLPVNLDIGEGGLEKARAFLAEGAFENLPLYADSSFQAFERLKREAVAIGLPATLLLDENGCELGVLQGPAEWNTADGERVIETLLNT